MPTFYFLIFNTLQTGRNHRFRFFREGETHQGQKKTPPDSGGVFRG
jgi:hypothetical protein